MALELSANWPQLRKPSGTNNWGMRVVRLTIAGPMAAVSTSKRFIRACPTDLESQGEVAEVTTPAARAEHKHADPSAFADTKPETRVAIASTNHPCKDIAHCPGKQASSNGCKCCQRTSSRFSSLRWKPISWCNIARGDGNSALDGYQASPVWGLEKEP
jgi:hypothetical protein